jgi:hypothetical protein
MGRPQPDPNVFLATANDVIYLPDNPEGMIEARRDLDQKRVAAVQRYLTAQMAGRPMQFEVAIHDPFEVGANGNFAAGSARLANAPQSGGPMGNLSAIGTAGGFGMTGAGSGSGGGNQTGQFGGQYGGQYGGQGTGGAGGTGGTIR